MSNCQYKILKRDNYVKFCVPSVTFYFYHLSVSETSVYNNQCNSVYNNRQFKTKTSIQRQVTISIQNRRKSKFSMSVSYTDILTFVFHGCRSHMTFKEMSLSSLPSVSEVSFLIVSFYVCRKLSVN